MKYITKQQESPLFSQWKVKRQNTYDRFKKTSATDSGKSFGKLELVGKELLTFVHQLFAQDCPPYD
jgi:hypothetical protein